MMVMSNESAMSHLSSAEIAAYVDGKLAAEEKGRIQSHLADCSECRAEMTELTDLLHAHGRRKRWALAGSGVAAAVAVILLFIASPLSREAPEQVRAIRSPEGAALREAVPTISVAAPAPDATVEQTALVFTWRPVGEGSVYRLAVTDEGGDPVWHGETYDTTALFPSDVVLEKDRIYLWYVDALLADGQTATTGVLRFRTAE